jgi:outer membrane protein TolC
LNAEYNYSAALFTLAALMGYPEGTIPETVSFPAIKSESETLLLSVDAYLDMALANRPDLKAYREQLKMSEYRLYQSYSAYSPTLSAFGDYMIGYSKNIYHGFNFAPPRRYTSQALNYGLTAEWVIFNGFQRYNATREAQANVAVADFAVAQAWLNVVNDVRTAYANYDLNNKQANLFSDILGLVKEQRRLVQAEYDAGQAEIVRLNEAQRNLVSAQGTHVQAMANMQKARAQLEAAANINNLGRGYEKFSGAKVTMAVYQKKGMKANLEGKADAGEVAEYTAISEGKVPAGASTAAPAAVISPVGPVKPAAK